MEIWTSYSITKTCTTKESVSLCAYVCFSYFHWDSVEHSPSSKLPKLYHQASQMLLFFLLSCSSEWRVRWSAKVPSALINVCGWEVSWNILASTLNVWFLWQHFSRFINNYFNHDSWLSSIQVLLRWSNLVPLNCDKDKIWFENPDVGDGAAKGGQASEAN